MKTSEKMTVFKKLKMEYKNIKALLCPKLLWKILQTGRKHKTLEPAITVVKAHFQLSPCIFSQCRSIYVENQSQHSLSLKLFPSKSHTTGKNTE